MSSGNDLGATLLVILLIGMFVCPEIYWRIHTFEYSSDTLTKDAKITNISTKKILNWKLRTKVEFSDGSCYFSNRTTSRNAGIGKTQYYVSKEVYERIVREAVEKHLKVCEKEALRSKK